MMMVRQLRAEIRKGLTPVTAGTIVASAALAVVLQVSTGGNGPAPSLVDQMGAIEIALLQHATLVGFVLAGIVAGQMTGTELSEGSLLLTMTAEPRRARLFVLKTTATVLILVVSSVLMATTLTLTGRVMAATGTSFQDQTGTSLTHVTGTVSRLLLVLFFIAAFSTALAAWTASSVVPAITNAGTFIAGLMLSGVDNVAADPIIRFAEFTPYMWVTRWMQPGGFGRFADFIGNATTPIHIQRSAILLVTTIGAALLLGSRQLDRSNRYPKGNQ